MISPLLRGLLLPLLFFCLSSCKQSAEQGQSPTPSPRRDSSLTAQELEQQRQDYQQRIKAEQNNRAERVRFLERRIADLRAQIDGNSKLSKSDSDKLRAEIERLNKERAQVEADLASLNAKLDAAGTSSSGSVGSGQGSATKGVSGFPLCGSRYYGDEFTCGTQKCAKSDAEYRNTCELSSASKKAYPLCPSKSYGDPFPCESGRCAKSDPGLKDICQLAA